MGSNPTLVRVFLCPCVGPIPILGLIPDGIIGYKNFTVVLGLIRTCNQNFYMFICWCCNFLRCDIRREKENQPSLYACLHPGPPLQNRLWDILLRERLYAILFTGDLKKAFLQIRIKEKERDSLRFHWRPPHSSKTLSFVLPVLSSE